MFLVGSCTGPLPPEPLQDATQLAGDASTLLQADLGRDSCRRYEAGLRDRRTVLLCGKHQFFYETFGTNGVPAALPEMLVSKFPVEVGHGFSRLGMIADPTSSSGMPLSLAEGKAVGAARGISFTCASCHLARLPDGRLSIGAPNHDYEYGLQILALTVLPALVANGDESAHAPAALARLLPLWDRVRNDPQLKGEIGLALVEAVFAGSMPKLTPAQEEAYARWPTGTQDFTIAPLPIDDGVEVVTKIPALWAIPTEEETQAAGMTHGLLGWSGTAPSMMGF